MTTIIIRGIAVSNIDDFHIEYSFAKTSFWVLALLVISLLFLFVGVGLLLFPFLFAGDNIAYDGHDAFGRIFLNFLWLITSAIVLPFGYAMFVTSIRHLKNSWSGQPLAIFTQSGVKGFTTSGASKILKWEDVDQLMIQPEYGNLVLWDEDQIDSVWSKFLRTFSPIWNPNAVSIQTFFGREKLETVEKSFFELNPYAEERFGP